MSESLRITLQQHEEQALNAQGLRHSVDMLRCLVHMMTVVSEFEVMHMAECKLGINVYKYWTKSLHFSSRDV